MDEVRAMKNVTDRAAEAIEAAEVMFADEIGATLDLSPAAKVVLISRIAAAIQAAVVEEREKLIYTDEMCGSLGANDPCGTSGLRGVTLRKSLGSS